MIRLTDEMRAALDSALTERVPALVGTASAAGEPDMAYKGSLMVWDDEHLAFWERARGTTLRNMEENPHVVALYRNPETRLAWKFFGRARLLRDGDVREGIMARTNPIELSRDPDRKGIAVLIEVDRVLQGGQVLMQRD